MDVLCDDYNKGVKREASIAAFSSFPSFDQMKIPQHKIAMGKTTVEYWPPDLDKNKFYNLKKDSVMELWPGDMSKEMRIKINEPMLPSGPDVLPDIPLSINEQNVPEIYDFQAMLRPTESSIIEDIVITNRSPIVFPTSEPTTRSPDRQVVAFVSRGGNKKRKLKKKVKPVAEVPFAETSETFTPSTNSVIEVMPNGEQQNVQQATPIYEFIDEPVVNIFQPIRYTDVVSNLSNLTQQTFGVNNSSNTIEIIDSSPSPKADSVDLNSTISVSELERETMGQINETLPNNDVSEITLSFNNDLSPIDIMLNQLKSAIEERDLAKIREIVQSMDENVEKTEKPKAEMEKVQVTMDMVKTTQAVETKPMALPTSTTQNSDLVYVAPRLRNSKVYLAPRVRDAQKKLKKVKAQSLSDEKLKEEATTVVTEIPVILTTKFKSTTEKMKTATTVIKPTKGKRSHITPRSRQIVNSTTKSSRKSSQTRRRTAGGSGRKPI